MSKGTKQKFKRYSKETEELAEIHLTSSEILAKVYKDVNAK